MKENEVRDAWHEITKMLIEKGLTITTMESCTSGQAASLITDTEGSSAVLKGACISYSNEAKILFGVPKETVEKYSVYSGQTAIAMARACRSLFDADIGVGVTGTMGNPDPANPASSIPGQVWFAFALRDREVGFFRTLQPEETRFGYKMTVCGLIAGELKTILESLTVCSEE